MALALSELFPDEDYRFHLTLRKGDLAEFFRPASESVLRERRRWLEQEPVAYVAMTADAAPLVAEFETLARSWIPSSVPFECASLSDRLISLGGALEPDFVLLGRSSDEEFRLQAGVVCFPTAWALGEKVGLPLEAIHGPVPGLNPALAAPIRTFLTRLKPGQPYERTNWGLTATCEHNLHPKLIRPRLASPLNPRTTWLRIEDQILAALPESGGVLFGIRLRLVSLAELVELAPLRSGFQRAVATMPEAVAQYKGLADVRREILSRLA